MKHLVFRERALLPVSAACVVANAMRERLATLSRAEIDLRLWPPAIPSAQAWDAILAGARIFVVRGTRVDAAIVLRPCDGRALAALLFGEDVASGEDRALSPFESEITRRAVAALAPTLAPVCGETRLDECAGIDALTYFELHVVSPGEFCIGVALTREPQGAIAMRLEQRALHEARIVARVELALEALDAPGVAALQPGDVLGARSAATLAVNGEPCARGACGVAGARLALRVESVA